VVSKEGKPGDVSSDQTSGPNYNSEKKKGLPGGGEKEGSKFFEQKASLLNFRVGEASPLEKTKRPAALRGPNQIRARQRKNSRHRRMGFGT